MEDPIHPWCQQPTGRCRCTIDSIAIMAEDIRTTHDLCVSVTNGDLLKVRQRLLNPDLLRKQLPIPRRTVRFDRVTPPRVSQKKSVLQRARYRAWPEYPWAESCFSNKATSDSLIELFATAERGDCLNEPADNRTHLCCSAPCFGAREVAAQLAAYPQSSVHTFSTVAINTAQHHEGYWTYITRDDRAVAADVICDLI